MFLNHRIVGTVNKKIRFRLVFNNTEFAPDIIFKLVFIPVEVVFSDIGQNGDIGSELREYHPAENC